MPSRGHRADLCLGAFFESTDANVFFNVSTPKFSALATRKAGEIGWKPL